VTAPLLELDNVTISYQRWRDQVDAVRNVSLSVQPGSTNAESLYWTVRCAAGNAELGRVRLDQAASGWTFEVPASCPAQWLELVGSAPDVPRQSDVTIANLGLAQGNGR